jgi:protein-S-isoprenylcysteine O-methyltransferase Ste14
MTSKSANKRSNPTIRVIPPPWNFIDPIIPGLFDLIHCAPVKYPCGFPHKIAIDLMKAMTAVVCISLSFYFKNTSNTMMTYSAIHGTYGVLWLLKSRIFPDLKWEKRVPYSQLFVVILGMGGYWITPYRIAKYNVEHSNIYLGSIITLNILGVFLHFTSDMQKAIALSLNPGHLITDRLFSLVRHPNYLGEGLIYASFVLLADTWWMTSYFLLFVMLYWVPNMWWKENSMSRYENWKAYTREVPAFIPFIF